MPRPSILIVDEIKQNLLVFKAFLSQCNADIYEATSGKEALALTEQHAFALILLDVHMPVMNGFEVAEKLHDNPATAHTPIIFVTANHSLEQGEFNGYASGAVDYLEKPVDPFILKSKTDVFLDLWNMQRSLAEANERILSQQQELKELSIRDHLTGLYQRRWFDEMLIQSFAAAERHEEHLSLAMLDIDHFKSVNDVYGHPAGDAVLKQTAKLLSDTVRAVDTVFRFGGEEFMILMPDTNEGQAFTLCDRLRDTIASTPIVLDSVTLNITISIGIAERSTLRSTTDYAGLVKQADDALYQAKHQGRNQVVSQGNIAINED